MRTCYTLPRTYQGVPKCPQQLDDPFLDPPTYKQQHPLPLFCPSATQLYRRSQKVSESKNQPTLKSISSVTKKFGGIWNLLTGGMGYGTPVEDSAPCQKGLD